MSDHPVHCKSARARLSVTHRLCVRVCLCVCGGGEMSLANLMFFGHDYSCTVSYLQVVTVNKDLSMSLYEV